MFNCFCFANERHLYLGTWAYRITRTWRACSTRSATAHCGSSTGWNWRTRWIATTAASMRSTSTAAARVWPVARTISASSSGTGVEQSPFSITTAVTKETSFRCHHHFTPNIPNVIVIQIILIYRNRRNFCRCAAIHTWCPVPATDTSDWPN